MTRRVQRWMMAAIMVTVVLANSALIVHCPLSVSAQEESNVPDCCKNGICPHHAAEHKQCQCDLFSDPLASIRAASITPATFFPSNVMAVVLRPDGAAVDEAAGRTPQPVLILSTPPPKA